LKTNIKRTCVAAVHKQLTKLQSELQEPNFQQKNRRSVPANPTALRTHLLNV
jgi:hypothetical protein